VPPFKFSDVPFSESSSAATPASSSHNYRSYKTQFQAPQQVGTYTLHVTFVSDTFLGQDETVYMQLKVDDLNALDEDEKGVEDEISEPEEDTLAGQMAAMRGGSVKKSKYHDDEDEDESTTDGDEDNDSDSSDSD
jgi:translocation protein SEC63